MNGKNEEMNDKRADEAGEQGHLRLPGAEAQGSEHGAMAEPARPRMESPGSWVKTGAQPTETARALLKKAGAL